MRSLIFTAVILAILILAGFAVLFVLDVMPREELQEALKKTALIYVIALVAAGAIWGVLKSAKKN